MFDTCNKSIETDVVSVRGASCTSTFATIVHLMATKSSEVAVIGFVQKISTSSVKVMRYSQTASTDSVISTYVHMYMIA